MKLPPDQRRKIMNEMELVEAAFTEKRWAARYGISIPTVRRLRREMRDRKQSRERLIPLVSHDLNVICFATPSKVEETVWPEKA